MLPQKFSSSRRSMMKALGLGGLSLVLPAAGICDQDPSWTTEMPPLKIAENLYYVGSRELASFLVTSSQGHVLINSNLVSSPSQIRKSVEGLGFRWREIGILLISHAHFDHCAGSEQIRRETGARYMVMQEDVPVVESGGAADFHFGSDRSMRFAATKVDRVLSDGESVELGGNKLVAWKTAGHTKGCTSWAMTARLGTKTRNVVIVGSPNVLANYDLIHEPRYPEMAADFRAGFKRLSSLPCDLFLGAHGSYFGLLEKAARHKRGDAEAFADPEGYRSFIANRQGAFEAELARQRRGKGSPRKA